VIEVAYNPLSVMPMWGNEGALPHPKQEIVGAVLPTFPRRTFSDSAGPLQYRESKIQLLCRSCSGRVYLSFGAREEDVARHRAKAAGRYEPIYADLSTEANGHCEFEAGELLQGN
jgi:hypothetical protein